jgi:hypothetical protein
MARIRAALMTILVSAVLFTTAAAAQERSQGVSMHMLPKRAAQIGGMAWGFTVDYSPRLKPELQPPAIQTVADLVSYIRKQDDGVQENGIWIVTTNPDAYSEAEKTLLENVKAMCRKEKIPLFICRGAQLLNGWVRFDK